MSHIFEGYFSRTDDSDLSDGIAETVLRSVMKNCPVALKEPDNYSARANLMNDSSIACSGIPEYGKQGTGWPCHAMEHELSAFYDITHGADRHGSLFSIARHGLPCFCLFADTGPAAESPRLFVERMFMQHAD